MDQQRIFADMALKAWNIQLTRTSKFFDEHTDEQLEKEVAPGKNRLLYLLGHLVAVHDNMIPLLGLGERTYAHLDEAFLKNPDRAGLPMPTAAVLREDWKKTNETLTGLFENMAAADWFTRHAAMTDEDFAADPARNKLSVLLNRTSHLAYHLGQLVLAK